MQENNENEISLLELWNKIWKNKFIIAAIVFVVTLVGMFFIFLINRNSVTVTSNFTYRFIGSGSQRYPDGSFFNYRELLQEDELTKVKKMNDDYKNLDIEAIVKDSNAEILYIQERNKSDEVISSYYQINLPTKYFDRDVELTEQFIKDIHLNLLNKVEEKNEILKVDNYFKNLNISLLEKSNKVENLTYQELIRLFKNQNSLLVNNQENFIARYGATSQVDNVKFDDLFKEYLFWYENTVMIGRLETEIYENNYVRNIESSKKFAELELIRLRKELAINILVIEQLTDLYEDLVKNTTNSFIGENTLLNDISNKIVQNITIERDIIKYEKIINGEHTINAEFDDNFELLVKEYDIIVDNYNEFYIKFLNSEAIYLPHGNKEFEVNTQFNLMLMGVVLVLVSGLGGVVFALIKEAKSKEESN